MSADRLEGRTPPRSEEAERALVGALLLDGERVAEIAESVQAEDFFDKRLGRVFECLVQLADQDAPVDFVTVGEALRAKGWFEEVGGSDFLVHLAGLVTSSAHALYHANLVADNATLRRLIHESTETISQAYETPATGEAVKELLDETEQKVFKLARREKGGGAESIAAAITETFKRIDASTHTGGLTGLTTGYIDLDQKLCGLNAGDMIVIAARPSMGKTAFALNMAQRTALAQPEFLDRRPSVLFFSLEMGVQQLVSRLLCTQARVDAHKLRAGRLPREDRQRLTGAADELSRTSLFIDDTSGISMMSVRSRARRLKAKHGLDLVVVDYLQLLSFPKSESRQQEISNISRSLKGLARELEVPVVALAQLSRQVELREGKRPQLADLRESGTIEQDADVVMLLYRPEYYPELRTEETVGMAEVIIAKQRNGPTGSVKLAFQADCMRFEDSAPMATEAITL